MNKNSVISIIALIVAVAALVMCSICCMNKGGVEKALQENPKLVVDALQNYDKFMRDEALKAAQGMIKESGKELYHDEDTPFIGNKDGKVVLVEFFDFSCGYCHRLYPTLKTLVEKNPELKIVMKQMTFLSPVSAYATKATLAADKQGKFAPLLDSLMTNEGRLTESVVDELAAKNGVDVEQMKADMNSQKTEETIAKFSLLAQKLQINGVPTLVINDKILQTLDEAEIQKEIDAAK